MFEQDGVQAMKRTIRDSPVAIMRGECDIPVPAHFVVEMVTDSTRKAEWDKMFLRGQELERLDADSCRHDTV